MSEYDNLANALRARLAELTERSERIEGELRAPLDADFSEQANQLEDEDALEGIDDVLIAEITSIRAALARIDDGSYGSCAECGEEIALKRLEAIPTATQCIACASE